jgi:hypothetical protein
MCTSPPPCPSPHTLLLTPRPSPPHWRLALVDSLAARGQPFPDQRRAANPSPTGGTRPPPPRLTMRASPMADLCAATPPRLVAQLPSYQWWSWSPATGNSLAPPPRDQRRSHLSATKVPSHLLVMAALALTRTASSAPATASSAPPGWFRGVLVFVQ